MRPCGLVCCEHVQQGVLMRSPTYDDLVERDRALVRRDRKRLETTSKTTSKTES